jgi:hypothetical protein
MAARMRDNGMEFDLGGNLGLELALYDYATKTGDWGIFDKYADEAYDSSADYWKLTDDGKLIFDGRATVTDAETGEVLISIEELDVKKDSDYIGALAKMFNVSKGNANRLVSAMFNENGLYIQLGTEGANFSNGDYLNALKYALTDLGKSMITGMNNKGFNSMTVSEQTQYLERQVIIGGALFGSDRGRMTADLRGLNGLHDYNTLSSLFDQDFNFMNDELRDFLNLNVYGSNSYDYNTVASWGSGWGLPHPGKDYHIDPVYAGDPADWSRIRKYTHDDGRETVFGLNQSNKWELVTNDQHRGTYNYGYMYDFLTGTVHHDFDMDPYFKKFNLKQYAK